MDRHLQKKLNKQKAFVASDIVTYGVRIINESNRRVNEKVKRWMTIKFE